jgi:hypothetical protein
MLIVTIGTGASLSKKNVEEEEEELIKVFLKRFLKIEK